MSDPVRVFGGETTAQPYRPPCNKCGDPAEERQPHFVEGELPEGAVNAAQVYYTGLCKLHGELEYSERWQKRWAKAETPDAQSRLIEERRRWEQAGHTYRGISEREDRRTGS